MDDIRIDGDWDEVQVWANSLKLWDLVTDGWEIVEKTVGAELLTLRRAVRRHETAEQKALLERDRAEGVLNEFMTEFLMTYKVEIANIPPGSGADVEAAFAAARQKAYGQIGVSESGSIDYRRWWLDRKIKAAPTKGTIWPGA